jgi:hypothetical protein
VADSWTRLEVEAAVAAYFEMLTKELRSESINKTTYRRSLSRRLDSRSDGSIERKHQNISAIMIELGLPYINGYKPLSNYQSLLRQVVVDRLQDAGMLRAAAEASATAPAPFPVTDDILGRVEEPPLPTKIPATGDVREVMRVAPARFVNYLERESRNASLGRAGEEFVVQFERMRLRSLGMDQLAARVEHVSLTVGDGEGFDVLSFDVNGSDRLIEVKTTAYGKQTPFFVSRNEVGVSRDRRDAFHLYRLFQFRRDPRMYMVRGALDLSCRLDAIQYSALPA